jgi:hypothetical protein
MKTRIEAFIEMLENNDPSGISVGTPIRFSPQMEGIKGGGYSRVLFKT